MTSSDDKKQIQAEIFDMTGCKVEAEDPLVVAALFFSEKIRAAANGDKSSLAFSTALAELRSGHALKFDIDAGGEFDLDDFRWMVSGRLEQIVADARQGMRI